VPSAATTGTWVFDARRRVASWFGDEDAERRRREDTRRFGDDDGWRRQRSFGGDVHNLPVARRGSAMKAIAGPTPAAGRRGFGETRSRLRSDRGWTQDPWTPERQRDFGGSASGLHDPHYSECRQRQLDELDRDYDDYRRENQSRFESDFGNWRTARQGKRQLLGQVREHMTVVGSDEEHVGTVDHVRGDRIILTKGDSDDSRHHVISCSLVDRVEGDR
jgi:hypothetical protein